MGVVPLFTHGRKISQVGLVKIFSSKSVNLFRLHKLRKKIKDTLWQPIQSAGHHMRLTGHFYLHTSWLYILLDHYGHIKLVYALRQGIPIMLIMCLLTNMKNIKTFYLTNILGYLNGLYYYYKTYKWHSHI